MTGRSAQVSRKAPPRTLTERELNRALLARQLLLERGRMPLPQALERVGGIQAQYAPSMYVGLWSRLEGFKRESLTRALERKTVVQGTLMRITIHLVSARDYWPLAVALRDTRRVQWLRYHRGKPSEQDVNAAAKRVRRLLANGPRRRSEIDELIGKNAALFNGAGLWLDLVRSPPSGTWEHRRADIYALAEDWLGPPTASPQAGLELLVRRYLSGFGPAARKDVADYAGMGMGEIEPALEPLALRRFRAEDGTELLDLPRAPLPGADRPAPVRFLPTWDATLLVHARRTQILPERYRPLVFSTKTPHSINTFLVDGAVAGSWREEKARVKLEPFDPLPRKVKREVEEEAARLERFLK